MTNTFLEDLAAAIRQEDAAAVYYLLTKNQTTHLAEEDIYDFLSENSKPIPLKQAYTVCGSGGSGISKPNISSLACLYLSCCHLPILKIGSRKKTSLFGSTDFFDQYGLSDKYINDGIIQFAYYDVDTVKPWFKYRHLLPTNSCFRAYFDTHIFNEITFLGKFVGCLGPEKQEAYMMKDSDIPTQHIHMYYSYINGEPIDELVGHNCFVDGNKATLTTLGHYSPLSTKAIIELDDNLCKGICGDTLWYHSLRNTVALALVYFKGISIRDAYEEFDNIFETGGVATAMQITNPK